MGVYLHKLNSMTNFAQLRVICIYYFYWGLLGNEKHHIVVDVAYVALCVGSSENDAGQESAKESAGDRGTF